ncbi:MAG: hypothetical protein RI904_1361, partial [Pseudomonadota bacterium]
GLNGQLLQQTLDQAGLQTCPVKILGDTRQAFSVHESTTGKDFRFLLPGPTLTESEWQPCIDTILTLAHAGDTVVASGSLPSGVPDNLFATLATALKNKGARLKHNGVLQRAPLCNPVKPKLLHYPSETPEPYLLRHNTASGHLQFPSKWSQALVQATTLLEVMFGPCRMANHMSAV